MLVKFEIYEECRGVNPDRQSVASVHTDLDPADEDVGFILIR